MLSTLLLLSACIENNLTKEDDPVESVVETEVETEVDPTDTEVETEAEVPCDDFDAPALEPPVAEDCELEEESGIFDPTTEWTWRTNTDLPGWIEVISVPLIANLTDDDGDGDVDTDDVPDVVFLASSSIGSTASAAVTVISGDGSGQHFSVNDVDGESFYSQATPAVGDLDGDGVPEICAAGKSHTVVCLYADGSLFWAEGTETLRYGSPAIADMDGDGSPEVVVGRYVFDATGTLLVTGPHDESTSGIPTDLDGDGLMEVVTGSGAFALDGTELWVDTSITATQAVADFDGDGEPEVVRTADGVVVLNDTDGTELWSATVPTGGGGVPTVADLDGDGEPEIGVVGNLSYTAFEPDGSELWSVSITENGSSAGTGSSIFDFEGDGFYEVVYADEDTLWVFEGSTGATLLEVTGHASGTAREYPTIGDIDGDGSAEILVGSNTYFSSRGWVGITAIGSKTDAWQPARPIWNQYTYHISNVEDDGTILTSEVENWTLWNNFRAADDGETVATLLADLVPDDAETCLEACELDQVSFYAAVYNAGAIASDESVWVLQRDDGTEVDAGVLPAIDPEDGELLGPFTLESADWGSGSLWLVVDPLDEVWECDEDDGALDLGAWPCP